jgi:hypothetical protein
LLLEIAREEAAISVREQGAGPRIEALLGSIAAGTWQAGGPADGMDPAETLARVTACVTRAGSLRDAVLGAVRMGGDTDTVAALVAGILGCRLPVAQVREELSWLPDIKIPDAAHVRSWARGLRRLRLSFGNG